MIYGSPFERGSQDAFFWRPPRPHKLMYNPDKEGPLKWEEVVDPTYNEYKTYLRGYNTETNRYDYLNIDS